MHWGVEVQLHALLTLALDGGEWSVSQSRERAHGTHWLRGLAGPTASLDAVLKRRKKKNSAPTVN
jgi:hypothetical protein